MKKLYKILGSVLICFSVMFGSFTVFAASPTVQVSNYTNNSTFTYSDNTYYAQYRTIFINCSDVSSGTVVIDFSGMSSSYKSILNSYKWFSEGCRVSYNSSTYQLTVSLSGVQFCTIGAYYISTAYVGFNLSYSITNNLTIDTDGTDDYYDSVLEEFGTLEAYADDIASDVNNMYLILVDMLGDVGDINTAMTSVNNYLSSLDTAVSTLKTLATSSNAALTSILNILISVGDDVSSIDDSVQSIYSQVTDLLTSLNNIDDTLDTISWVDFDRSYNFGGCDSASDTWTTISSDGSNSYTYVGFNVTATMNAYGQYILYLRIPAYITTDTVFYQIKYNGTLVDMSDYVYIKQYRYFTDVFIYESYNYNSYPNKFVLTNVKNVYPSNSDYSWFKYISSSDIEYWQLLQYFDQYKSNLEIISLLNSINSSVSNIGDTTSSIDSTVSEINSNLSDIDNTLDTISWDTYSDSYYGYRVNNIIYEGVPSDSSTVYSDMEFCFMYDDNSWIQNDCLYWISLEFDCNNDFSSLDLYFNYYRSGLSYMSPIEILYYDWSSYDLNVYFTFNESWSSFSQEYYLSVVVPTACNFSGGSLSSLPSTDIEYWQLLNAMYSYSQNLEIISLLEDLNGLVDGSVDDSDFSSDDSTFDSTFEDYQDTTDSIFDTFEDSVSDLDLTDSAFSLSDSVLNGVAFLSSGITSFVSADTGISILFYLPLLLGVIMLFLGIRR